MSFLQKVYFAGGSRQDAGDRVRCRCRLSVFSERGRKKMQIREPIVFQIAHRTWCINEFGMDALFLLEGSEKALLIDTGTGVFDLPALVRSLTDKPLITALTHGHVDHAGGIKWFDEVYLHPEDHKMARELAVENRQGYVRTIMSMADGLYSLGPENVIDGSCDTKLLPLREGDLLHLGDRDVAVYETPGHTAGSVSFLDVRERILFSGDACNPNTLMTDPDSDRGTISALLASARKIESLHPYYDRNYNGHIGYAGWICRMEPMAECLTRDCIELCEGLLDGSRSGEKDKKNAFMGECLLARNHTMQILYHPVQLR